MHSVTTEATAPQRAPRCEPRPATAITDLNDLAITRHSTLAFMPRAYELRSHVTPYDAASIGLAEALDCDLLTADARLARARILTS